MLRMPPPDLQEIGLGDGLLPVAHPHIVAMRELQIARRRVAQLQEGEGEVERQRIFSSLPPSPAFADAFQSSGGPSRNSLNRDLRAMSKPLQNAAWILSGVSLCSRL